MGLGDAVLAVGHPHAAEAGEVLMREGDAADRVIVLRQGRVKVTAATPRGPVAVLGFRSPGEVVGEVAVLTGAPRMATVTAIEPLSYVAAASSVFRHHLVTHPELMLSVVGQLAARLSQSDRRLAEHLVSDTAARVAARLVDLADQYGQDVASGRRIDLPLTQEELAGFTGSSLEAVTKALRVLRTAGWIETSRRAVTLTDLAALRARAGG